MDESRAAVEGLMVELGESFMRSIDDWLDCFAEPFVIAGPLATLAADRDTARAFGDQTRNDLIDRGLVRTEFQSADTEFHGQDLAVVDARFHRLRADGSLLEEFGAVYVCRRRGGRWVVVTLAPRAASTTDLD